MLSGNKGEWSEIYTLFKIISDKSLVAGDSELKRIEDLLFPIIRIIRDQTNGTYEYDFIDDLVFITGNGDEFRIPIAEFHQQAKSLLASIKQNSSSSFQVPETERFLQSFNCLSLKAKSSAKTDIKVVIHDLRTGTTPELGFSIKSQLGNASTLLNAGRTTNFIFRIDNLNISSSQIARVNSIDTSSKIKDRIEWIEASSGRLKFLKTESPVFGNNLTLIDSALPTILSEIVYLFFTSGFSKMRDLVDELTKRNPIGYDQNLNHPFYKYKVKRFLTDIALGMMPSKVWTGELDATGGYLVVKEDGEVLCYHIYNRNEFEDYLLNNTKLETASSTRHDFGTIHRENNKLFFKLNLQIRFIK
jgi:type II restriction enzyme